MLLGDSRSLEEELPGQGYNAIVRSMRLLTRDCMGNYQRTGLEESLVYHDAREVDDWDLDDVRPFALTYNDIMQVVKIDDGRWLIAKSINGHETMGALVMYNAGGAGGMLRHHQDDGDREDVFYQRQHWIVGSSLVQQLKNREFDDFFGHEEYDSRQVVTFGHNMFLYQEKGVFTCKSGMEDSYTYRVKAWYKKV